MSSADEMGVFRLIWSDYVRHSEYKAEHPDLKADSRAKMLLLAVPRFITNSSLRACLLVRLTIAAPVWLEWLGNSVLIALHSSRMIYGCKIGPGLSLPHPWGIGIGSETVIGRNATICMNVSIGSDVPPKGQPVVGDDVVIFGGASIYGPITIGDGALVGSNCILKKSLPPGAIASGPPARIIERTPGETYTAEEMLEARRAAERTAE